MIRPKGLGRGLDALLAGTDEAAPSGEQLQTISIDRLRPGKYQPRTRMDAESLAELALSIREQGIMQPILVRPVEGGPRCLFCQIPLGPHCFELLCVACDGD